MRKFFLFTVLVTSILSVSAQRASLSPNAAMLLADLNNKSAIESINSRYTLIQSQGTSYVSAFATLAKGANLRRFDAYGVKVNSLVSNMTTLQIPISRFAEFAASGLCSYIDLGQQLTPLLDKVRDELGVNYIHMGVNLPQSFDGTGVVVGVIDIGFDYGHPSFYDTTGTQLRIKRVWQQADNTGTAPSGFSYGSEYTTQEQILALGTDNPNYGHGSHTAGIAAGCGAPSANGSAYRGMAPGADIVMVATPLIETSIFDGIRYIHQYARSVGKPCVINISLGSNTGPHDGTGSFDRMIEDYLYTQPVDSLVVVVSAGNSGDNKNHLSKVFTPTDTELNTILDGFIIDSYHCDVDCWGDAGDEFSVILSLYKVNVNGSLSQHMQLPEISSQIDSTYVFTIGSPAGLTYNCQISVNHASPFNGRPEVYLYVSSIDMKPASEFFGLTVKSTSSANVHLWSSVIDFSSFSQPNFSDGDAEYTIMGMGGNSDAVITVGSYATRLNYPDGSTISQGEVGDLSTFSSHGPTYDGRTKPDIAAPGQMVVSVLSTQYQPFFSIMRIFDSTLFNGQTYYYAMMGGTSMSSPVAAGIVALWLQHRPWLNVDSVRTILHTTANRDHFTGLIPPLGSSRWGWGKINAFGGLPSTMNPMYYLEAIPNDYSHGSVTGGGRHPQGLQVIQAIPYEGCIFRQWSDGNTDNPRHITLNSDTMFVANFIIDCDTISQFPWTATLSDSAFVCWERSEENGRWIFANNSFSALGYSGVNNWLITPHVLVAPNTSFAYTINNTFSPTVTVADSIALVAITAEGDTLLLADKGFNSHGEFNQRVDLSPYAGQVLRFGLHYHACGDYGFFYLNSISIEANQAISEAEQPAYTMATSGLKVTLSNAPEGPLAVYDVMGRCVYSSPHTNGSFTLPTSGLYLLRTGILPTRKVVVVR